MADFVHLHVHTTYSLLDGQCPINALVLRARKWGMPALAVTDHGNLFALKAFYDACRSRNDDFAELPRIKPILGCEAYVTDSGDHRSRDKGERRHHLILLAKNLTGYHNLVRLLSEAWIDGFYHVARIDRAQLEKYHEGLICSAACLAGEVAWAIDQGRMDEAENTVRWYKNLFGADYYLEVMEHAVTDEKIRRLRAENAACVRRLAADARLDPKKETQSRLLAEDMARIEADLHDVLVRQKRVTAGMIELGRKCDVPIIATNDVHFLDWDDDDSHDVLLCLSTGKKLSDVKRMIYTGEEWFKPAEEMAKIFGDHPEFLANTVALAEKVENYDLDSSPIMPRFPIPAAFGSEEEYATKFGEAQLKAEFNAKEGAQGNAKVENFVRLGGYEKVLRIKFEADYLASLVWDGAKKRWGDPLPKATEERLAFELEIIKTMGFPGYFLIVHDYIRAAREMGVWVGPGRGSAAGAAVTYALGITNVDPLKFDLLFERFLNPDRISMPDIDVDFDDDGRGRVLEYVTRKYGQDHVAHIVTFGQMAPKSAIKDVGRAMEYPLEDTNKLAGLVPDAPKVTFKKAIGKNAKTGDWNFPQEGPVLKKAIEEGTAPDVVRPGNEETVRLLLARAVKLDGSIRQPGVHACGVIISRDPLIDTLPVMPTENEALLTTQYDGHFVEPVGLLKMDFLGLKTLSVEKECVALIKQFHGVDLNMDAIPDDDRETYELFSRGDTTGLFQFESDGMKKWLRALQPERLSDLVAMNALYRPGPMDYIPAFVERKQGREPITYDHPLMEQYLKDTYGVTVYQEQVMLLSRLLAGFSRGDSDRLRKAMGKKKIDEMNALKARFVTGCLENPAFRVEAWSDEKTARELVEKIWKDWEAFASYAFNKSHAVCYAWVAYQTGYLKAHYPAEFMCAQISSEIGNFDKLPGFVAEASAMGLEVKPPDVNAGFARFTPVKGEKAIRYGLAGVKGVGGAAADAIVAERMANGPYRGMMDLVTRLAGQTALNKRTLENLILCGAFDSFITPENGFHRARFFQNVDFAFQRAAGDAKQRARGQTDFFALMGGESEKDDAAVLPDCLRWPPSKCFKAELDLTGIYLTGHPLGAFGRVLTALSTFRIAEPPEVPFAPEPRPGETRLRQARVPVRLGGMLKVCQQRLGKPKTKRVRNAEGKWEEQTLPPQPWAILTIDDGEFTIDALCFAQTYEKYRDWLPGAVDSPILVCGEISHRTDRDDRLVELDETQFIVREVYPLSRGIAAFSESLVVTLQYEDPALRARVKALGTLVESHPGSMKVVVDLRYQTGTTVRIEMAGAAEPSGEFFAALGKALPENAYRLDAKKDAFLEKREPKPWERG